MDLYQAGLSVSQGDNLTASIRSTNQSNRDFNKSLAEQRDVVISDADTQQNTQGLLSGAKLAPTAVKAGTAIASQAVGTGELAEKVGLGRSVATNAAKASEVGETAPKVGFFTKIVNPASEGVSDALTTTDGNVIGTSDAAKAASAGADVAEEGGEIAAEDVGRAGLAGIGGVIEIGKDFERGGLGSNWEQKAGNISSIIGSGLEVVGALTAFTGFGIGLEGAGIALSLAGGGVEAVGDAKAATATKNQATTDVTTQSRSAVATQESGTVAGRSN